jgi:hypothetical protein
MDPIILERVLLIWMLLSMTLGNCALFKSSVHNFFLNNDLSIESHFPIIFKCNFEQKRFPSQLWWKELRQHIQWDFVESTCGYDIQPLK